MLTHVRRFPVLALTLLAVASCDDEPDPTNVTIGLPDALSPISVSTAKNTPIEATVPVSSIDGRTLSYAVLTGPSNGTVDLTELSNGVRVRYTPTTGFAGQDQVTFRVDDGVSTVDGEVDITVTNAPPSVSPVALRRPAIGPVTIEVSGTDPDGDALTFEIVDGPGDGSLSDFSAAAAPVGREGPQATQGSTTRAQITYTPNEGYLGDDTFTYRATDGDDPSQPATVTLTANLLPVVMVEGGLPVVVQRNAPKRIRLSIDDGDGDDVTTQVGEAPAHGSLGALEPTGSGFNVLFTPDAGFAGDDSFTVVLDDGFDTVSFEVTITVVNEAPRAFNSSRPGFVGADVSVELTGADPDGDPLTFEIVDGPTVGTLGPVTSTGPATAEVVYSPGAAGAGPQTFTFRVTDGISYSAPATITVVLLTEAPLAQPTNVLTPEDTPIDITLTGIDQQGDVLSFAIATPPSHGTLGAITPLGPYTALVTYTPDANYSGADLFTFTVSDGTHTSDPGTVGVTMTPVEDPPIVVASPVETFTTHTNVVLEFADSRSVTPGVFVTGDLLSNFIDAEMDGLTISLETATVSAGASVTLNADGTFVYTPPVGRVVDDTFDYTVTDGTTPVTRTVTIHFAAPVWFVDDTFAGTPDGTSAAPFTTVGAASAASGPGDIVFVYSGSSGTTPLAGGFTFQANQQLVGEPRGLTTAQGVIVPTSASARPVITNAAGAGVTLADGAVLEGFDIVSPTAAGVTGTGVSGVTLRDLSITGTGGNGVEVVTATDVVLQDLVIGDASAVSGSPSDAVVAIGGSGVVATDVTGSPGLTLDNVLVSRTADHGVQGIRVTGLTILDSEFLNNGTGAGDDALRFGTTGVNDGLFGTASITNTVLDGFSQAGLVVQNSTGSLSLQLSGLTVGNNQGGTGAGTEGVVIDPTGTAQIVASVTGASTFATLVDEGVLVRAAGGGQLDLTVDGASFNNTDSGAGAIAVYSATNSTVRVDVANNDIQASAGSGIYLEEAGASALHAYVRNNVVGTAAVVNSGAESGNGVSMIHSGTGTTRVWIDSNTLHSHQAAGIFVLGLEVAAADGTDSDVNIVNNVVAAPEDVTPVGGIQVAMDNDHVLCTTITGNTSAGSAGATGIEVQQSLASVFGVVGLGATAIVPYLESLNTATAASFGGAYVDAGVPSCTAPTPPTLP